MGEKFMNFHTVSDLSSQATYYECTYVLGWWWNLQSLQMINIKQKKCNDPIICRKSHMTWIYTFKFSILCAVLCSISLPYVIQCSKSKKAFFRGVKIRIWVRQIVGIRFTILEDFQVTIYPKFSFVKRNF